MIPGGGPLFGWPERNALRINLLLASAFAVYFEIVYWAGNVVATNATARFHVALPYEMLIPFVPWTAAIYLTVTPFLCLAPFIFWTPQCLLPLFATLCAEVTIAGMVFCVFPVELSFPPQEATGFAGILVDAARAVALPYNCVPSLHVALALTAAWAYASAGGPRWRFFVWSWAGAIAASTLLTHQHHLVDLAAGALLSGLAVRYVAPRVREWVDARQSGAVAPPQASGRARGA
jgi:membrane-associated phospholipid phosphatase